MSVCSQNYPENLLRETWVSSLWLIYIYIYIYIVNVYEAANTLSNPV